MANMELILLKDVDNLGYADDIVQVKPGYGRNFLIPQKMAVVANSTNRKLLNERMKVRSKKDEAMLAQINDIKAALDAATLKIEAKAGTTDKLYGSVTTHHIANAIKAATNYEIDRRKIQLEHEVKTLGEHQGKIALHKDHVIDFKFEVVPMEA